MGWTSEYDSTSSINLVGSSTSFNAFATARGLPPVRDPTLLPASIASDKQMPEDEGCGAI